MQQLISLIPVIALVVVGFLVMRSIAKTATSNRTVALTAANVGARAHQALPPMTGGEIVRAESQEKSATDMSDLGGAARARAEMIRQTIRPEVDDIPEKFDANLVQILRMADHRPEAIAMLVKSWLLEEAR
jgi:flagellar biosynthesis/type III secretory pathway M-ring protein FliF/YscJ